MLVYLNAAKSRSLKQLLDCQGHCSVCSLYSHLRNVWCRTYARCIGSTQWSAKRRIIRAVVGLEYCKSCGELCCRRDASTGMYSAYGMRAGVMRLVIVHERNAMGCVIKVLFGKRMMSGNHRNSLIYMNLDRHKDFDRMYIKPVVYASLTEFHTSNVDVRDYVNKNNWCSYCIRKVSSLVNLLWLLDTPRYFGKETTSLIVLYLIGRTENVRFVQKLF